MKISKVKAVKQNFLKSSTTKDKKSLLSQSQNSIVNYLSIYNTKGLNFKGTTNFFALTDIHQSAEKHCRMVNEALNMQNSGKQVVLLDNGDLFKGIYPKQALLDTYKEAKESNPNIEIIFNIGNNDFGYDKNDRELFKGFVQGLNKVGGHIISANIFNKETNERPKGIEPFALIERDGDKLIYVGFAPDVFSKKVSGMKSIKPAEALEQIAPEIKKTIEDEHQKGSDVKGLVFLVHDGPETIKELKQKADELGFNVKFAIGGHLHYSMIDMDENIFMPEPFAESMLAFDIDFDSQNPKIKDLRTIKSMDCETGIFTDKINEINAQEEYYKPIAKSVMDLNFVYDKENIRKPSELGTFYADGIRNISHAEIGIVPKAWIYKTMKYKPNGYVNKMEILTALSQPVKPIFKIKVTPDTLKAIYQKQLNAKGRLLESSQNVSIGLNGTEVKQISINGVPLFDENGNPLEPERKIVAAIDYYTVINMDIEKEQLPQTMYDGFVENLKVIEQNYTNKDKYPTAHLYTYQI